MDTNSFKPQNTLAAAAAACELRNCMSVFEAQVVLTLESADVGYLVFCRLPNPKNIA